MKNRHTQTFLLLLTTAMAQFLSAQSTQISGTVNHYASVSAIDPCSGRLSVSDTTGFRKGGDVILIQMQGATIESADNAGFGNITSLNQAGVFEKNTIDSVAAGTVFLRYLLVNQYDAPTGKVQIVTNPIFENATVAATVRPKPWDGATGGVVAFEVKSTLTLQASISADTCGFRGGKSFIADDNDCYFLFNQNDYYYNANSWRGAPKGEGVAAFLSGKENGRGPQANGGGGGNDHNSGGGGGANVTNGGRGGDNDEPSTTNCQGYYPGIGGKKINGFSGRIFLGGGGGGGHANNLLRSTGGRGGGVIIVSAAQIVVNQGVISANGESAKTAQGDGGGGGGAGGTIVLNIGSPNPDLKIEANGGNGADQRFNQSRCFGPGGGGSGGRIVANLPASQLSVLGGKPGTITLTQSDCLGSTGGAENGDPGVVQNEITIEVGKTLIEVPEISAQPMDLTICAGDRAIMAITATGTAAQFQWQADTGSGWMDLVDGSIYSGTKTDSLYMENALENAIFRCLVSGSLCPFTMVSGEAALTVVPKPVAGFSYSSNMLTVSFTNLAQHFDQVFWDFGDGFQSTDSNPVHVFPEGIFNVVLCAISECDTVKTGQVIDLLQPPSAAFSVPDTVKSCVPIGIVFENMSSGNTTAFNWSFPGGQPSVSDLESPTITYSASGDYTAKLIASNLLGSDSFELGFRVEILPFPVANFQANVLSGGLVAFTNLSQSSDSWFWFFGDGFSSTERDPVHLYTQPGTYTVTLQVDNFCGAAVLQQEIKIETNPTIEPAPAAAIRIYPNPASDRIVADFSAFQQLPRRIKIFDAGGKKLMEKSQITTNVEPISIADWPLGIYFIQVVFPEGNYYSKFVKE